MKQNIPWIFIIPTVIVLTLIVIVYLLSRPDDVSCPDGMYFNSSCEGGKCTWICPEKYSNDNCDCTCKETPLINDGGDYVPDSTGECINIKADDPDVNPADQIKNCICTSNYCSEKQLQQNKTYDPDSDNCDKCKVVDGDKVSYKDACTQENAPNDPDSEYCCANGSDCSTNESCYPPYKTFLRPVDSDPTSFTEEVCDQNTGVAVDENGNPTQNCSAKHPELCCKGTRDECCRQYCGIDGQTISEHTLCSNQGDTCLIGLRGPEEDDEGNPIDAKTACQRAQYCNKWVKSNCPELSGTFKNVKNCSPCNDEKVSYEFAACTGDANLGFDKGQKICKDGMCITRLIDHLKNKGPGENIDCTKGTEVEQLVDYNGCTCD